MKSYEQICAEWQPPKTVAELEMRLSNYSILFAYHSGKMENEEISYYDTREIFENGKVVNYTGDLRTLYEIRNQKICYDYLKDKIIQQVPMTVDFIKKVHKLLMNHCYDERRYVELGERPGEFKKHEYEVGRLSVGLPSEDIEPEMQYLCEELVENERSDRPIPPLRAASWFHLNFENIHPFADGNGRTGRTLFNYYLMTHGHPPVIIYEEDRKDYYQALEAFDETEELAPFETFVKGQVEKTWNKPLRKTPEMKRRPLL